MVSLTWISKIFFKVMLMKSIKIGAVALIAESVTADILDKAKIKAAPPKKQRSSFNQNILVLLR